MQLPKTTMFRDIFILDCDEFKEQCSYCFCSATKSIVRTCIHSGKKQKIHVCNTCLETEIKGIRKYRRREAD